MAQYWNRNNNFTTELSFYFSIYHIVDSFCNRGNKQVIRKITVKSADHKLSLKMPSLFTVDWFSKTKVILKSNSKESNHANL